MTAQESSLTGLLLSLDFGLYLCVLLCDVPDLLARLCLLLSCRSKDKIKMGVWNTVNLERASRKGEININGKDPVRGESPVRQRERASILGLSWFMISLAISMQGKLNVNILCIAASIKGNIQPCLYLACATVCVCVHACHCSTTSLVMHTRGWPIRIFQRRYRYRLLEKSRYRLICRCLFICNNDNYNNTEWKLNLT